MELPSCGQLEPALPDDLSVVAIVVVVSTWRRYGRQRNRSDMEICKTFRVDAAHRLTGVPSTHLCSRLHGHSFRVDICVAGDVREDPGWVMDFATVKEAFLPLYEQLDHRYLNEIKGLENPTCENIAKWIWTRLKPKLPELSKVGVAESPDSSCLYCGPKD